ncbi:TRAP transporter small permease [Sedimentibacter sp.]|uniref:TRAP transporter small permease n=2 Tax=Sedimentibacter sp. TaxID=1960295 RepID=UPI0028A6093F|nr:TRAP transporter small permease [Sedimentibacter sp.]
MKIVFDKLEKFILGILSILFTVMVVALFYQIIMRFLFESANSWSEELTRYSFIWMSMLGSAIATRRSRHMNVDFLMNRMPKILKIINSIIIKSLIIAFLIVIIFYGISLVSITFKQLSPGLRVPMAYMYASVPIGGILMLLFTIEVIINDIKNKKIAEG